MAMQWYTTLRKGHRQKWRYCYLGGAEQGGSGFPRTSGEDFTWRGGFQVVTIYGFEDVGS